MAQFFTSCICRSPALAAVVGLLALFTCLNGAQAQQVGAPLRYVYDPAKPGVSPVPNWFREIPAPDGLPQARRDFQIVPPRAGLELAITISFVEPDGAESTLEAFFRGARVGRVISGNLYEGTGLPGQRTLVLRKRLLTTPGVLSLIADGPELRLWRMELQWLQARSVLVPAGTVLDAPAAVLGDGSVLTFEEVAAGEDTPPQEEWLDHVIRFPLVREPERIEEGVEYAFKLGDAAASVALLRLDLAGLPPDVQVRAMLNGEVAGWLQVAFPSLAHAAYRPVEVGSEEQEVAGWRAAQAWVPTRLLLPGENLLWLEFYAPAPGSTQASGTEHLAMVPVELSGVALRHMLLELDYTPAQPEFPLLAASDSAPAQDEVGADFGPANAHLTDDPVVDEQMGTLSVSDPGDTNYDLLGDIAPALRLFLEDVPEPHPVGQPRPHGSGTVYGPPAPEAAP